jgi:hypothetical protein
MLFARCCQYLVLTSAASPPLQAALQLPDLWYEADMLQRLIYKNSSQHRGGHVMRTLRGVHRQLRLLAALQLPQLLDDLAHMLKLAAPLQAAAAERRGMPSHAPRATHRVPCAEACALAMQRMRGGAQLAAGLVRSCLEAARHALAQVAKTFFIPMCMVATALLARVQVGVIPYRTGCVCEHCTKPSNARHAAIFASAAAYSHPDRSITPQAWSMQAAQAAVAAYNGLAALLPLLPAAALPGSPAPSPLAGLPPDISLGWTGGLPVVRQDTSSPDQQGWVAAKSGQLWDELGLMQGLEPQYVGPPIVAEAAPGGFHQHQQQAGIVAPLLRGQGSSGVENVQDSEKAVHDTSTQQAQTAARSTVKASKAAGVRQAAGKSGTASVPIIQPATKK